MASNMNTNHNVISKVKTVVIFGAGKTGKSSIMRQFLHRKFCSTYIPTIEDVTNCRFRITNFPGEFMVQFIEAGGQYEFPAMWNIYINKAQAFILVLSVLDKSSLDYLNIIFEHIHTERGQNCHYFLPLIIAANKTDVENSDKQLTKTDIENWLQLKSIDEEKLIFCSAKSNESIDIMFRSLWLQKYRHLLVTTYPLGDSNSITQNLGCSSTKSPNVPNNISALLGSSTKFQTPSTFTIERSLRRCSDAIIIPAFRIERSRISSESFRLTSLGTSAGDMMSTLGFAASQKHKHLLISKSSESMMSSTATIDGLNCPTSPDQKCANLKSPTRIMKSPRHAVEPVIECPIS